MDKKDAKLLKVVIDHSRRELVAHIDLGGREEEVTLPQTMPRTNFWHWAKELKLDDLAQRACGELMQRYNRQSREADVALKRMRGEPY